MNKQEFIDKIAGTTKLSKVDVTKVINTALEVISNTIKKEPVVLTGFGVFTVSKRAARTGRNPKTGTTIKIPAMKVPRFKAGKALKQKVR